MILYFSIKLLFFIYGNFNILSKVLFYFLSRRIIFYFGWEFSASFSNVGLLTYRVRYLIYILCFICFYPLFLFYWRVFFSIIGNLVLICTLMLHYEIIFIWNLSSDIGPQTCFCRYFFSQYLFRLACSEFFSRFLYIIFKII